MHMRTLCLLLPILAASAQAARLPFRRGQEPVNKAEIVTPEQLAGTKFLEQNETFLGRRRVAPVTQRRRVRRRKGESTTSSGSADCGGSSNSTSSSASSDDWSPSATSTESAPSETESSSFIGSGGWATPKNETTTTTGYNSQSTAASWGESSSATGESSYSATSTSSASTSQSTSTWQLVDTIAGSNFFDSQYWTFWDYSDPTHGDVNYVDSATAWSDGLVSIDSNNRAIMKVETTATVSSVRKSVRLHSNRVWTGGMVLMDAYHMPTGCGTWPAWWQNGPNWPQGGEIDILEGVNTNTQNQVSLHTGVGCTMPTDLSSGMSGTITTGSWDSYDCSSTNTGNQGCGVMDTTSDNSYGTSFNNNGGGVYALVWVTTGISVWFHPRGSIPSDITNGSPDTSNWGTPIAHFPSTNCNMYEFFYDQFNIFDTTLCGDWAGSSGSWASCAASTGYSTCSSYVQNEGAAFSEAYWAINSVTYYNSTSLV